MILESPQLDSLDVYRQRFTSAAYWEPYVRLVCERHRLAPCASIRSSIPGTYPVFIIEDRWVAKFFGRLFNGWTTFVAETEANRLITTDPRIPAPALLASGTLVEHQTGWPWPYLIFRYVPGVSLSAVYEQVSSSDKLAMAQRIATIAMRIHALPIDGTGSLQPNWDSYIHMLRQTRLKCVEQHQTWGTLPQRLIDQVDAFVPPANALVRFDKQPCLLHADLTADHVLGTWDSCSWNTQNLIDFGDAIVGDPEYELIAAHLDLFRLDKSLLRAYMDAYGVTTPCHQEFAHKIMSLTLLHQFNVLECVLRLYPRVSEVPTLEALASLLWDLDAPGLSDIF